MWMAMPNSGSMETFEKIGAMSSSASKKEGAFWLGGLPPNGRSTSGGVLMIGNHMFEVLEFNTEKCDSLVCRSRICGGREAVWRLHWLDPARSRLENIIGWACGLSRSNWNRKGGGKFRNVKVGTLWIQESMVDSQGISCSKSSLLQRGVSISWFSPFAPW